MVSFDSLKPDMPTEPAAQDTAPQGGVSANFDDLVPDSEKYGSTWQQVLTGIEGAAQGALGPLATAGEAGLSKMGVPGLTPEDQELRAQASPVTRYGSEAASFGASQFFGVGEAGVLARIGKGAVAAADLGKAARIANFAVQGGAEVAALQAGNEISKAINQDPNQTLGSAAINIGLAGILGAGGSAALGAVGPLWKGFVSDAAEAEKVGQAVASEGDDLLGKSIMKPKEKLSFMEGLQKQKENADEIRAAGELIGAPVSSSQTSASDYVQGMDSALSQSPTIAGVARRQEIDAGFGQVHKVIDDVFGDVSEASPFERGAQLKSQIQTKADEFYQPLKEGYAARGELADTISLPDTSRLKKFDGLVELSQKFEKASPEAEKMVRDAADGLLRQESVGDLDEYLKKLAQDQRSLRMAGKHYEANALGEAIESLNDYSAGEIAKQSKALGAEGAEHAVAIGNDIINQHKALKAQYANFKEILSDLASGAKLGKKATTMGGLGDALEKIPNEKLVERLFDPKNYKSLKDLQAQFPDVFKSVIEGKKADLIAAAKGDGRKLLESIFGVNSKGVPNLPKEIRNMMFSPEELAKLQASKTWIESLPKNVGPSGTPKGMEFMKALHQNPLHSIVNNFKDMTIKQLLKFAAPPELEANKAMSEYINNSVQGEKALNRATGAFFKTGELIPQHLLPTEKSRDQLKKQLSAMNESPDAAINIGGAVGQHLPNHAAAAGVMAATAQNYFNALKPKQVQNAPLDSKAPINKQAEAKYNRALDIAQQPLLVLQHAKNGTLQAQDVQTLNTIYPALHSQLAAKLSENMIKHVSADKPIPYAERRTLSMLMNSPLDSTMTPMAAQTIMHANSTSQTSQSQGPQQQKTNKASGTELTQINKVASMYQTPGEQRQMNKKA